MSFRIPATLTSPTDSGKTKSSLGCEASSTTFSGCKSPASASSSPRRFLVFMDNSTPVPAKRRVFAIKRSVPAGPEPPAKIRKVEPPVSGPLTDSFQSSSHPPSLRASRSENSSFSNPCPPVIRLRTSFSFSQLETLESAFTKSLDRGEMRTGPLAATLDVPVESVVSWFASRLELQEKRQQRMRIQLNKRLAEIRFTLNLL